MTSAYGLFGEKSFMDQGFLTATFKGVQYTNFYIELISEIL
jgi:hypothetical protein